MPRRIPKGSRLEPSFPVKSRKSAAFLIIAAMVLGKSAAADADAALPRYRLATGQHIRYEIKEDSAYYERSDEKREDKDEKREDKDEKREDKDEKREDKESREISRRHSDHKILDLYVERGNPDGSWNVILLRKTYSEQEGRTVESIDTHFPIGTLKLFPDGRFSADSIYSIYTKPSDVFIPLPQTPEEAKSGWTGILSAEFNDSLELSPTIPWNGSDTIWEFSGIEKSLFDSLYGTRKNLVVHFDPVKGLVTQIEAESYSSYGESKKTIKLVSVKIMEESLFQELIREAGKYLEAEGGYQELIEEAGRNPRKCDRLLKKGAALLQEFADQTTNKMFEKVANNKLERHERTAEYVKADAKIYSKIIASSAPRWTLKDLEGNTHSLKSYRGKVVLLDFWYRNCGWCIRSMPQLSALAEQYKDKPVVILGMNVRDTEEVAREAAGTMKLAYPTLLMEADERKDEITEQCGVKGYPTMTLIDQRGKIADIHRGYSPDLRERFAKKIDDLLAGKEPRSKADSWKQWFLDLFEQEPGDDN